ncbi:MAG: BTAD domain-containing putative transcriptional regulator [Caldilineaceae bacterium]
MTALKSRKALALFLYLACTGHAHPREVLADLLWEAASTTQSLSNLRTILSRLPAPLASHLLIERDTIAVDPTSALFVDADELVRALAAAPSLLSHESAAQLGLALESYEGDFLAGFQLNDAPRFEEWMVVERERLRMMALAGYQRLTDYYLETGAYESGIQIAAQLLHLDPTDETGHGHLMRMLAYSGQRTAALAQFETCREILQSEFGVEPNAELQTLVTQIRDGQLQPPARASADAHEAPLHNLPAALLPLIGRDSELAQLQRQMLAPATRLITILGEGGIGKTRLALAFAQAMVDAPASPHSASAIPPFPDGVWWTALASVTAGPHASVENVLATAIAEALHISFLDERATPAGQLVRYLRPKTLLLVLDNFDELTAGVAFVVQLLEQAPGLRLLITSRTPLNCQAEQRLRLGGLPTPPPDAAAALATPSEQLFVECLHRKTPNGTRDVATLTAVAQLCRQVHGHPLALELAAHWGAHFSVAEMVSALQQADLSLLNTDERDVPERHRSIEVVFDTSWRLLAPNTQHVLAKLAVFHGSFGRQAAQIIAEARLTDLVQLVDHSLLGQPAPGRYELHGLLRQFAAHKLSVVTAATRELYTAQYRHAAYYLHLMAESAHAIYQVDAPEVLRAMQPRMDNVRAAWRWAMEAAELTALPVLLMPAWLGLRNYYHVRNLFQEGQERFHWAVNQIASRAGASTAMLGLLAKLQAAEAFFLNLQHRPLPALAAAQQAVRWAEAGADEDALALATLEWGISFSLQRQNGAALPQLQAAVALAARTNQPHVAARALHHSYRNFIGTGNAHQARAALEQARVHYRNLQYRLAEGFILQSLGYIDQEQFHYSAAVAHLKEAQAIYLSVNDEPRVASFLSDLGWVYECQGEYTRARQQYAAAEDWAARIHDPRYAAELEQRRGLLAWRLGDETAAWAFCGRAQTRCEEIGYDRGLMRTWNLRGLLHQRQADYAAALPWHDKALALETRQGHWVERSEILLCKGGACCGLQQWEAATAAFQQAITIAQQTENLVLIIEATAGLAQIALAQQQLDRALALVEELLPALSQNPLHGAFEPALVYLTCSQILQAHQDDRAAVVLTKGYHLLTQQAAILDDPALRHSFLDNVPANRALLAAYHAHIME